MGDELFDLLAPTVVGAGLELVDVEVRPGLVRVTVDAADGGAELDAISEVTRAVSVVLDAHDPMPGRRYTLEVSSPGVERPLRDPRHFARAVGEKVTLRTRTGGEGERRFTGTLTSADDTGFVLAGDGLGPEGRRFVYDDIDRARTVFEWGPDSAPRNRPGGGARGGRRAVRTADRERVTTP